MTERESWEASFKGNQEELKDARKRKHPTDRLSQQIYDAHQNVMTNANEIEKKTNNLQSLKKKLSKLTDALQLPVAKKNKHAEEVHGSQT